MHKVTADIADFHYVDAARIGAGKHADLVVIDPHRLDDTVEEIHEEPMPSFPACNATTTRPGNNGASDLGTRNG